MTGAVTVSTADPCRALSSPVHACFERAPEGRESRCDAACYAPIAAARLGAPHIKALGCGSAGPTNFGVG